MSDVDGPLFALRPPGGALHPDYETAGPPVRYMPEARYMPLKAPDLAVVLAVWWSYVWRWWVGSQILTVPVGLFAWWYLVATGFDFLAFTFTGADWWRLLTTVALTQWALGVAVSVWALRAALWRHGALQ